MAEDFMAAVVKRVEEQFAKAAFSKAVQHLKEKTARSRCAMV